MPGPITIFSARRIITMDPAVPEATHGAVRDGLIIEVGDLDDCSAWGAYTLDDRFGGSRCDGSGSCAIDQSTMYVSIRAKLYSAHCMRAVAGGASAPRTRATSCVTFATQPIIRRCSPADSSCFSCSQIDRTAPSGPVHSRSTRVVSGATTHGLTPTTPLLSGPCIAP